MPFRIVRNVFKKYGARRFAVKQLCVIASFLALFNQAATAQTERVERPDTMGTARLFTNDFIGDRHDRWNSGSYFISAFSKELPSEWYAEERYALEYRLRSEFLMGWGPQRGFSGTDRPYGVVGGIGVFRHEGMGNHNLRYGLELTGVSSDELALDFHEFMHEVLGVSAPNLNADMLNTRLRPAGNIQYAYDLGFQIGPEPVKLRPFAEVEYGLEAYSRIGLDAIVGPMAEEVMFTRDHTTGVLVAPGKRPKGEGSSLFFGVDVAAVTSSDLFDARDASSGVVPAEVSPVRARVRGGVVQKFQSSSIYLGWTYLAPQFKGQKEGQIVGSIMFDLNY